MVEDISKTERNQNKETIQELWNNYKRHNMHAMETLKRQKHHLNNNDPEFPGFMSNNKAKIQRTENKQ